MGWIWLLVMVCQPLIKINSNLVRVENRTSCWDLEFYVLLLKEILLMGRNWNFIYGRSDCRIMQAIFILIAVNSVKKYSEIQRHNLKHHFQYTCFLKIRRRKESSMKFAWLMGTWEELRKHCERHRLRKGWEILI